MCDLAIIGYEVQPSSITPGYWQLELNLASSAPPIKRSFIAGPQKGAIEPVPAGLSMAYNLAAGSYTLLLEDDAGCTLTERLYIGPTIYGCTDPDADNYDPNATDDNGSCFFSQRLKLVAGLPELAPLGVPLVAAFASASVAGAGAAPATCLLDLGNMGEVAGVQLRVNGYLFTSGPLIVPGRFRDASSLVDALRSQPALAAGYTFSVPVLTQVLITARTPGLPGTPEVSTSNASLIGITSTPGVAGLHSQRRLRWGCYVEVMAGCGNVFGGPVDKATAQLAQRIPLDYRASNRYEFDIAPALRQFTGHAYTKADGTCPDRLVSYFLRFGEEYADSATGLRRARSTYESSIAWGLEAMEVPAPVADLRLLTARPQPWGVAVGDLVPVVMLGKPTPGALLVLRSRLATTRATTELVLAKPMATGVVNQSGGNKLTPPASTLAGQLMVGDAVLASLKFGATGPALTFVNRQGGTDTVRFGGSQDDTTKRTAATYTNTAGPQNQSAELALPTRLYSGLLDYPTWDWLRRELGTSPAAWLETDAGSVPVLLSDVATDSDARIGEYSLTVDYTLAPVRGLSN
jgi:hypothetical protein